LEGRGKGQRLAVGRALLHNMQNFHVSQHD
jgi:hypothetical protein